MFSSREKKAVMSISKVSDNSIEQKNLSLDKKLIQVKIYCIIRIIVIYNHHVCSSSGKNKTKPKEVHDHHFVSESPFPLFILSVRTQ